MAYRKITSKEDYRLFLAADRFALGIANPTLKSRIKRLIFPHYVWSFLKCMRMAEYYKNCKSSPFSKVIFALIMMRFRKLSLLLGFDIPLNTCGPGLSIPHHGTIVVNHNAKIGTNCRLHVGTVIGASAGEEGAPNIGDNCYIGPGAKVFGDITLGDNIIIGANSVVNKSISESGIAIAGMPAKKIADFDVKKVILLAYEAAKLGMDRDNLSLSKEELNALIESKWRDR